MDVFEALTQAAGAGHPAVLVTVISVEGEAPSRPGAKLVVSGGYVLAGTLGCAEFDTAGLELAGELAGGAGTGGGATLRRRVVFGHGRRHALELFAERHDPTPTIFVAGDTPVGRAVAALAEQVGRRIQVLADPLGALRARPLGRDDALVVSDHDAPYVEETLRLALAGEAFFVGMLGSRRHAPGVVAALRAAGVTAEQVARLRSPCGLDIGSRTPEEIGLSIVAEIVAVERGRDGGRMGVDWSGAEPGP